MRKSERVHPLCPMDNTHGILKLHAENALAACSTVLRTMGLRRGYDCICCRTVAFAITYVSKSFFEVKMATSSSRVFSTKRECLGQNKFFGIISFS